MARSASPVSGTHAAHTFKQVKYARNPTQLRRLAVSSAAFDWIAQNADYAMATCSSCPDDSLHQTTNFPG